MGFEKFKIGDKIVFKSWEEMEKQYGLDIFGNIPTSQTFVKDMKYLCGVKAIITNFTNNRVYLELDPTEKEAIEEDEEHYWGYSTQMIKFAKLPQEQIKELVERINKLNKEKEKGEVL